MPSTAKKIWNFIWHDNSIWSWIVNIILALIIVKFLIYPGLGFAFQTSHPVVAVVSKSMEHEGGFNTWWESKTAECQNSLCSQELFYLQLNISRDQFIKFPLKNGFLMGDIMVLKGTNPKDLNIGDVIVFRSKKPDPIIHRIIEIKRDNENYIFRTKGDRNKNSISLADDPDVNEFEVTEDQVIGRAILRIPFLGWVKILFTQAFVGGI